MNLVWILRFCKNKGVGDLQIKNEISENKCKIELLELSSYWMRVLQVTKRSSGLFPCVGEDYLYSSPEPDLHLAIKPNPK